MNKSRSLIHNEQGAILVAGVIVTPLLIGFLMYMLGVGVAWRHGEHMRDGADSAAFTAATIHARAMNLVAMANIVKMGAAVAQMEIASSIAGADEGVRRYAGRGHQYVPSVVRLKSVQMQLRVARTKTQEARFVYDAADRIQKALQRQTLTFADARADEIAKGVDAVDGAFVVGDAALPIDFKPDRFCEDAKKRAAAAPRRFFDGLPHRDVRQTALDAANRELDRCRSLFRGAILSDNAALGGPMFQRQAFAVGEPVRDWEEAGVRVATWGRTDEKNPVARLRLALSRIGFAQAEFYTEEKRRDDMLWSTGWTSRFRLFLKPDDRFTPACQRRGRGVDCNLIAQSMRDGRTLIFH